MKTKNYILMILILCLMSVNLISADDFLDVIISKGDVKVQKVGDKTWKDLKSGKQVKSSEQIKIAQGSYLGLKHSKGLFMELRKEGTIKVKDIIKDIKYDNAGMLKKFGDYVFNQLKQSNNVLSSGDKKNYTEITGTVERSNEYKIKSMMPSKFKTNNSNISLNWNIVANNMDYKLEIADRYGKSLFTKDVNGNTFNLNAKELGLENNNYYFWKVINKNNPNDISDDKCFNLLSSDKYNSINSDYQNLQKSLSDNNSALSRIVVANFFDQNEMFFEAQKEYVKAIELAPDVDEFKMIYQKFLDKNKVNR
jgi:hypothetical protein